MPDLAKTSRNPRISVITPTLGRPHEISGLMENLGQQTLLPAEIIIVDGAPKEEKSTEKAAAAGSSALPFPTRYIRQKGGTAIQRNAGLDAALGDFIAFIDDDIRLEPQFFRNIMAAFDKDKDCRVGGIAGYITNQLLDPNTSLRWRWYKRLHLFTTYEPGRYDFETGYPVNRYLQPPHEGLKQIDFMGAGCAVWRSQVFANGLRFSAFFSDFGVLEDAHLALRARKKWTLWECGGAHCIHLKSPAFRIDSRRIAQKSAVNYRYVFVDIVRHRTWKHEFRFWRVQLFDLIRFFIHALRSGGKDGWLTVLGKIEGIRAALCIRPE